MTESAPQPSRPLVHRWRYLLTGALIGLVVSIGEPMWAARGEKNYWSYVRLYFAQCGGLPMWICLAIGAAVARRVEARRWAEWDERRRRDQCTECGYDLTGNVSGRCPECGAPVIPRM